MRDINVQAHDGIDLAVRDHGGGGPNVLLLHGATRTLADWAPVLEHLDGVRVLSMDARWHGRSGIGEGLGLDTAARDVEAVIDAVGLVSPVIAGHSMGGGIAVQYGMSHPECRGILNFDGYDVRQAEFYDELPPDDVRAFLERMNEQREMFLPQSDEGDDEWREQQANVLTMLDQGFGAPEEVTKETIERVFVPIADGRWAKHPPRAFFEQALSVVFDVLEPLRHAKAPTLMVVCTKQPLFPPDVTEFFAAGKRGLERHLRAIAAANPNVQVETMDATHGVIFEQPEAVARHILSFVTT